MNRALPLNTLYFEMVCSLMHDISADSAPRNGCHLFTYSSDVHACSTRSFDAGHFSVYKSRLSTQLNNSFSILGAKVALSLICIGRDLLSTKFIYFYLRFSMMRNIMLMS